MGKTARFFSETPEFNDHEIRRSERELSRQSTRAKNHLKQMARDAVRQSVDEMMDWETMDSHYAWRNNKDRQRRSR